MFRDGDEVHLQSRNGKPMNRYFPEVIPHILALPGKKLVLDGELVIEVDGIQEFDLLSQRIHPAKSRVDMLAEKTPAYFVAFDLLAEGRKSLLDLPYAERRARLEKVVADAGSAHADDRRPQGRRRRGSRDSPRASSRRRRTRAYLPGERKGMVKIKRLRTLDAVVAAFRFGKAENTVGSLILGLYDKKGELHIVGHTSGFSAKQKKELLGAARALPDGRARLRRAEPLEVRGGAPVGGPAPRARVRDRLRPHHRQPDPPRRKVRALAGGQGPAGVHDRPAARLAA